MLTVVSSFSQNRKSDLADDILTTERKIVDAVIKTDTVTVSQLLSKDFRLVRCYHHSRQANLIIIFWLDTGLPCNPIIAWCVIKNFPSS